LENKLNRVIEIQECDAADVLFGTGGQQKLKRIPMELSGQKLVTQKIKLPLQGRYE